MADLNVTADFTDIEQLQRLLGELGPAFGRAVARIQRESKQLEKATEASANVISRALNEVVGTKAQRDLETWGAAQKRRLALMNESEKIAQRQATAEKAITQELVRQRDAADRLAAANAQRFQSQIGSNLGLGAQGISAGASASAFEAEIERLRLKYDQIYASSQLYERSLNELDAAHRLGAISTFAHAKAVDQLNLEYQQFQSGAVVGFNRFQSAQQQAEFGANRMGVVVQQAGYQVGDFLVQVQSGTNWMVAFGQQATQLAGLMTTFGGKFIGIGTALGIAIPLITALGAAWMRTSEVVSGETAIEDKIKRISEETTRLQEKWDNLKFGSTAAAEIDILRIKASDLRTEIEELTLKAEADLLRPLVNRYGPAIVAAQEQLDLVVEQLNKLEEQKRKQAELNAQLAVAETIHARMNGLNDAILMAMAKQEGAIKRGADRIAEGARYAESVKSTLESIGGMQLNVGLNIQAKVSGLPAFAGEIWDKLGALGQVGRYQSSGRGTINPDATDAMLAGLNSGMLLTSQQSNSGGGGGGGGGNSRLESLISELQTEQETLAIWYEESQAALQSASDRELEILGGKYEAKIRLEEEYQERLKEILSSESNYRLTEMGNMFSSLADLAGIGGKKMLRVQAALSAAGATIAAYETAIKAAAEAKTIPGRIAAYAKFLAVGLGAVAQIRQAGGVGGGSGSVGSRGSVGSSSVAAAAPDPRPQTVYIDSLQPDGLYTGQTLINLFDALYDENDKRGKVFVVARG